MTDSQHEFHNEISSARAIIDLITTMANNGDDFGGLEKMTLSSAGMAALEHLSKATEAAEASFMEVKS